MMNLFDRKHICPAKAKLSESGIGPEKGVNFLENKIGPLENRAGPRDYDVYVMPLKQKIFYTLLAMLIISAVGFIFYRSLLFSILLSLLGLLYPAIKTKKIIFKTKKELNIQFRDMLYSLASSLSAGKSVETAFKDVLKDLMVLYPDPDAYIVREVEYIVRRIELNEPVESVLDDFARRSHIEDIENFADVVHVCKRTGGNLVEVIKNASNIINDKIDIMQEIDTLLAERKFEQKILAVLPLIIIILLSASAEDYIRPMFTTATGRVVTTISIVLLALANIISRKIVDIKI